MPEYKTPGTYIQEIPTLPASIAGVETAIPAFIGYTEKGDALTPTRIRSLLEYEAIFGKGETAEVDAIFDKDDGEFIGIEVELDCILYQAMRLFFANGGGDCYVVSIGGFPETTIQRDDFIDGLNAIKKVDEPTLLLFPDAVNLDSAADLGEVQKQALSQANLLGDRFVVMDVKETGTVRDSAADFRDNVGANHLKYGASYYPMLNTTIGLVSPEVSYVKNDPSNPLTSLAELSNNDPRVLEYEALQKDLKRLTKGDDKLSTPLRGLNGFSSIPYSGSNSGNNIFLDRYKDFVGLVNEISSDLVGQATPLESQNAIQILASIIDPEKGLHKLIRDLTQKNEYLKASLTNPPTESVDSHGYTITLPVQPSIPDLFDPLQGPDEKFSLAARIFAQAYEDIYALYAQVVNDVRSAISQQEENLYASVPVYTMVTNAIRSHRLILPPSPAIAGIYAAVDRDQGVWKAPANVSLNSVTGLTYNLDDGEQANLNVDPTSGKSINAIRKFNGRGILIWGARTLNGNSNEWRYINVRRLFIYVEESTRKAMDKVVFDANTPNTWLKVKGSIEAFLTNIWRDGGLVGATPEDAFFVRVGLGTTMTQDDILNGRLIVEIGLAASRPAEFIILKFSHKLQEA